MSVMSIMLALEIYHISLSTVSSAAITKLFASALVVNKTEPCVQFVLRAVVTNPPTTLPECPFLSATLTLVALTLFSFLVKKETYTLCPAGMAGKSRCACELLPVAVSTRTPSETVPSVW